MDYLDKLSILGHCSHIYHKLIDCKNRNDYSGLVKFISEYDDQSPFLFIKTLYFTFEKFENKYLNYFNKDEIYYQIFRISCLYNIMKTEMENKLIKYSCLK